MCCVMIRYSTVHNNEMAIAMLSYIMLCNFVVGSCMLWFVVLSCLAGEMRSLDVPYFNIETMQCHIPSYPILFYSILFYSILFYSILFYSILSSYIIPNYSTQQYYNIICKIKLNKNRTPIPSYVLKYLSGFSSNLWNSLLRSEHT